MSPNEYIERNIKKFLEGADRSIRPTTSRMQIICRIGYNQAVDTLYEMERRGILIKNEEWQWHWTDSQIGLVNKPE